MLYDHPQSCVWIVDGKPGPVPVINPAAKAAVIGAPRQQVQAASIRAQYLCEAIRRIEPGNKGAHIVLVGATPKLEDSLDRDQVGPRILAGGSTHQSTAVPL